MPEMRTIPLRSTGLVGAGGSDPFRYLLSSTMVGGTSLVSSVLEREGQAIKELGTYVRVSVQVILEYERTILELQQELLHYKRLLAQVLIPAEGLEEHSGAPVSVDPASVRVINSIISASVPATATFTDFDEGEL